MSVDDKTEGDAPQSPYFDSKCVTRANVTNFSYTWEIHDFSQLPQENRQRLWSKKFTIKDAADYTTTWNINMYPQGDEEESKGHISLYLHLANKDVLDPGVKVIYDVILLDKHGKEFQNYPADDFWMGCTGWGWPRFMSRDRLMNSSRSEALPGDVLTVQVKMKLIRPEKTSMVTTTSTRKAPLQSNLVQGRLSDDLLEGYELQDHCDLVLVCKGMEFHCHRFIVASRSPLLEAKIDDMVRSSQGVEEISMLIDDIPSTDVLQEMLTYMYTGSVPHLPVVAEDLLTAACHYRMDDLEAICADYLAKTLSINNARPRLEQATRLGNTCLQTATEDFFKKNMTSANKLEWMRVLLKDNLLLSTRNKEAESGLKAGADDTKDTDSEDENSDEGVVTE